MNKKTEIIFKKNSDTEIDIIRKGKKIGSIWSQDVNGTTPYPHTEKLCNLNSMQICGFDSISEIWACGPFKGKKDCVISFTPEIEGDHHYEELAKKYEEYVKNFFEAEVKKTQTGADTIQYAKVTSKRDLRELKSFRDFIMHDGCD